MLEPHPLRTFCLQHIASVLVICTLTLSACSDSDNDDDDAGNETDAVENMDTSNGDNSDPDGVDNIDDESGEGDDAGAVDEECGGFNETAAIDEAVSGDLSNDRLQPSLVRLAPGANTVQASTGAPNTVDYFSVVVGPCDILDSMFLGNFTGTQGDEVAFMAIQQGEVFSVEPFQAQANINTLLGYSHFGTIYLDQDLLSIASSAPDAIGFTTPLGTGTYTFWIQQVGPESSYELLFNVSRVSADG